MVGEDILQGIEHVDSEIVAVVEAADQVRFGADTVAGVEDGTANEVGVEDVMLAVHYEVANVAEGYTDDVAVVAEMHVGIVLGVVIAIAQTGAGTAPVGLVDDAVVLIHNVYVVVQMRVGLGIEIGIDPSVVETGFEQADGAYVVCGDVQTGAGGLERTNALDGTELEGFGTCGVELLVLTDTEFSLESVEVTA
ncbi:unnamed protein product [Sphenostylis stenocarpa]|uniref:Uncharacterized protein n=1 Tax=Sphenostylis stenocarpa TaxID=92480 RepID=A0AA86V5C5_9FABA|nr:unnamed protein product [Sphenostylis stenocarpa]